MAAQVRARRDAKWDEERCFYEAIYTLTEWDRREFNMELAKDLFARSGPEGAKINRMMGEMNTRGDVLKQLGFLKPEDKSGAMLFIEACLRMTQEGGTWEDVVVTGGKERALMEQAAKLEFPPAFGELACVDTDFAARGADLGDPLSTLIQINPVGGREDFPPLAKRVKLLKVANKAWHGVWTAIAETYGIEDPERFFWGLKAARLSDTALHGDPVERDLLIYFQTPRDQLSEQRMAWTIGHGCFELSFPLPSSKLDRFAQYYWDCSDIVQSAVLLVLSSSFREATGIVKDVSKILARMVHDSSNCKEWFQLVPLPSFDDFRMTSNS